jgi:hypothetical protein
MASVDSLNFDVADCQLVQHADSKRIWVSTNHVAYRLKFDRGVIYWPFDLTDPDAAREFYRRECEQNAGVMLEMDVITAAGAVWRFHFHRAARLGCSLAVPSSCRSLRCRAQRPDLALNDALRQGRHAQPGLDGCDRSADKPRRSIPSTINFSGAWVREPD